MSRHRRARAADCARGEALPKNRQQAARKQHLAVDGKVFHQSVFDKNEDLEAAIAPSDDVLDLTHAMAWATYNGGKLTGVSFHPEVYARLEAAIGDLAAATTASIMRLAIDAEAASARNDGLALRNYIRFELEVDFCQEYWEEFALHGLARGLHRARCLAGCSRLQQKAFDERAYAVDRHVLDLRAEIGRVFSSLRLDEAAVAKLSGECFAFLGSVETYPDFLPKARRLSSPFRRRRPRSEARPPSPATRPPSPATGTQAIPGPDDFPRLGSSGGELHPGPPPSAWATPLNLT